MVEYKQGTIHCTRGDTGTLRFKHKVNGVPYTFQAGDKLVLTVKPKNGFNKEEVAMRITTTVTEPTEICPIVITKEDSKIGGLINKEVTYWYDVVLNEGQTILGYDESGPKEFILYPESGE